jgi:phenylalanyl-tRNA synthetase alpha chain
MSGLEAVLKSALDEIGAARDEEELERIRLQYLGRKGSISSFISDLSALSADERPAAGKAANQAKVAVEAALAARAAGLSQAQMSDLAETEAIDVTFPAPPLERGHIHLVTRVQRELETALERIGYHVELGPEVETEWYNFGALNFPRGHAARDEYDSFFFGGGEELLLRTHTSPVQIRAMESEKPPLFVIVPGRCYRRDAIDASHFPAFTQFEGLAVDVGLTVGDLKGTLLYMLQSIYGADRKLRFRPSFFPFTEPSFEFDVSCGICGGAGCATCGRKGWLELGGCGMVHPNVLRNGGVDPARYRGFAWGFGIERVAMQRYQITDIRLFTDNDLRFLEQF